MKDSRYEEALERAKQGLPIEEVFPELKESEDEKIRKKLVEYISAWKEGQLRWNSNKEFCSRALAYLERQKEQKPEVKDPFDDEQFRRGYEAGIHDAMRGKKPAEWSEEDEKIRQSLINDLENAETEDKDVQKELNEKVAWLKSLRSQPHWKPSKEQMDYLCRAVVDAKSIYDTSTNGYDAYFALKSLYDDLKKLL